MTWITTCSAPDLGHLDIPVIIERTVRRLLDSYQRTVRPIRDAIEPMDEDIAGGEVRPGDPLMRANEACYRRA